jgi:hypothetical protein
VLIDSKKLQWEDLLEAPRRHSHQHPPCCSLARAAAPRSQRPRRAARRTATARLARAAQDGNLFWEIGFTEVPEWPEKDRWHEAVNAFIQVLAYEKMNGAEKLYPTVRFQLLRDLYIRDWRVRTRRLGTELMPHYFPDPDKAASDMAAAATLSEYEKKRNEQILANQARPSPPEYARARHASPRARAHAQAMLRQLGITSLVEQNRAEATAARAAPKPRAPKPAAGAERSRASSRIATLPAKPARPDSVEEREGAAEGGWRGCGAHRRVRARAELQVGAARAAERRRGRGGGRRGRRGGRRLGRERPRRG